MTPLDRILEQGEGQTVELIATFDDPSRVASHVVAFLNSGGGYVVIGVDEDLHVVGVDNAEGIADTLRAYLVEHVSPKALLDVGVDTSDDRSVIVVDVPGGKDTPFVTDGRVFLRLGSATAVASGDDLHALLQNRVAEVERWERRPAPSLSEDDLNLEEVWLTITKGRELGRARLLDSNDDTYTVLNSLGMTARGQLTNAADICFGRNPALRHPQVRVRAFAFEQDRRGDFIDQQTYSGPVTQVVEWATNFIRERSPITAEFEPDRLHRRDRSAYPTYVVREGLVNALAHRDYASFSGGVTIEIYPTRVEIWNSGKLPDGWDAERLRAPHPSLPANPDIAHVLYVRGLMERIGRGTLKMIQTCREEGLPAPTWDDDSDGVRLTLYSRASRLAPEVNLNDRQLGLLDDLHAGDEVTISDYRDRFASEVSERQARRDLLALVEADLLTREGAGPATRYRRTERVMG